MISRPCPRVLEESWTSRKYPNAVLIHAANTIRVASASQFGSVWTASIHAPRSCALIKGDSSSPYAARLLTRGSVRSNEGPPGPFPHEPAEPPPLLKSVWIERWKPSCIAGFRPGTCPSFSIGLRSTTQKIPIRRPNPDNAAAYPGTRRPSWQTDLPEQGGSLHGADWHSVRCSTESLPGACLQPLCGHGCRRPGFSQVIASITRPTQLLRFVILV